MKKRINLTVIADAIGIVNIVFVLVVIILTLTTETNIFNNPTIAFCYSVGMASLGVHGVLRIIVVRRSCKKDEDNTEETIIDTREIADEEPNSYGPRPKDIEMSDEAIIAALEKPIEPRKHRASFKVLGLITLFVVVVFGCVIFYYSRSRIVELQIIQITHNLDDNTFKTYVQNFQVKWGSMLQSIATAVRKLRTPSSEAEQLDQSANMPCPYRYRPANPTCFSSI